MHKLIIALFMSVFVFNITGQPEERQVWSFYLSFWAGQNTWEWNENVLDDYPLIGLYNSKLPEVAATHIHQARSAGIDAFIVNWFGLEETVTTTPALNNLLDRAAEQDFKIGVVVDIYVDDFNQDRAGVVDSLRWLVEDRVNHPAYLHYHGKSIIFFAFQDRLNLTAEEWQAIRTEVDPTYSTIWISEGLNACCLYAGAMDGMYAFNMAWASGNASRYIAERNLVYQRGGDVYIPSISPGWDENKIATITNRPRPTSPRGRAGGQFLANSWQGALQAETDVIMIVTWNEFIENSHIEPSELYGTQSLDTLRPLIATWKGIDPPEIAPLPENYFAQILTETLLHTEPSTESPVIAWLYSNETFPVVDENNGLYGLELGGNIGYVLASDIRISAASWE